MPAEESVKKLIKKSIASRIFTVGLLCIYILINTGLPVFAKTNVDKNLPFCQSLWKSIAPVYSAIVEHPFVTGLSSGKLSKESFKYYMVQDALYLREFTKVLLIISEKAPKDEWRVLFARHAISTLDDERALHERYFKKWGMSEKDVYSIPMAPQTRAYTSHLLKTAHEGSFEEALVAVLPCYWIYLEVGKELLAGPKSPDEVYQGWIDAYSGSGYSDMVRDVLEIFEQSSKDLSKRRKEKLKELFYIGSRYEWMFWNASYNMQKWPTFKGEK
jgi:thiaminase (transcriptional activator TenA)